MPKAAVWLGGLGLIPFVALAVAVIIGPNEHAALALSALIAYGAVILSFLGGVDWGRALAADFQDRMHSQGKMMALSNLPPLLGWAALLLQPDYGLLLLMASFVMKAVADVRLTKTYIYPNWFSRLRIPLSGIVVTALALVYLFG